MRDDLIPATCPQCGERFCTEYGDILGDVLASLDWLAGSSIECVKCQYEVVRWRFDLSAPGHFVLEHY